MPSKYKPATFQPTVRPDWAGAFAYIPDDEKIQIFDAILRYPSVDLPESRFWTDTIKPDLDLQYETFIRACYLKKIGVAKRWNKEDKGIDMYTTSNTEGEHKDKIVKEKDKDKDSISGKDVFNLGTTRAVINNDIPGPSLEEVLEYAKQQTTVTGVGGFLCLPKDAEAFWAHYQSQGWRKSNESKTPVRDWKAQLRFWCTQTKKFNKGTESDEDNRPL